MVMSKLEDTKRAWPKYLLKLFYVSYFILRTVKYQVYLVFLAGLETVNGFLLKNKDLCGASQPNNSVSSHKSKQ